MRSEHKAVLLPLLLGAFLGSERPARAQTIFDLVARDDVARVTALLKANPELVKARNGLGLTLLHCSFYRPFTVDTEMMELLLKSGAEVNARSTYYGDTALHSAAGRRNERVVALLLAAGADVNVKNQRGRTPLNSAVASDYRPVIDLLLAHGAEMDIFDAAALGKLGRIRELLAKNPSLVNARCVT